MSEPPMTPAEQLKDDDLLTLEEFINLTKNAFGGERILRLN